MKPDQIDRTERPHQGKIAHRARNQEISDTLDWAKEDPRYGKFLILLEEIGGWEYDGLSGTCVSVSARDEYMILKVQYDPEGYWDRGELVLVELGRRGGEHRVTTACFLDWC